MFPLRIISSPKVSMLPYHGKHGVIHFLSEVESGSIFDQCHFGD